MLDSNPSILPQNIGLGLGFRVKFIPGTFQYGTTVYDLRDVEFASDANGGGFFDLDPTDKDGSSVLLAISGPQLYSGPESAPTLLAGRFDVFDAFSEAPLLLVVTAVPEPVTWGLMMIGLGAAVGTRRLRHGGKSS